MQIPAVRTRTTNVHVDYLLLAPPMSAVYFYIVTLNSIWSEGILYAESAILSQTPGLKTRRQANFDKYFMCENQRRADGCSTLPAHHRTLS